jgi:hypothetical protein
MAGTLPRPGEAGVVMAPPAAGPRLQARVGQAQRRGR